MLRSKLDGRSVALLFGAIFFNWDSIFKARNLTRPIFDLSALFAGGFMVILLLVAAYAGHHWHHKSESTAA